MKTLLTIAMMLLATSAYGYDMPWIPTQVEEADENGDGKAEYRVSSFLRGKQRLLTIVDTFWEDGTPRGRAQFLFFKGQQCYAEVTNYSSGGTTLVHFFPESGAGVSLSDKENDGFVEDIGITDRRGQIWAVFSRDDEGRLSPLGSMTETRSEPLSSLPIKTELLPLH